ncbi:unnamed protein product [Kluyveromyces dobzhanskii CBS 2104]|uniref:WGS project CCBQ000000000 data, contig 00106 n=1 Tax=Kluyveromyces dobzhanskii CBS 2104 TaxID=1427455 RepID=A0A0A8L5S4_9SACH|nr:unnamed protein product [Kluyveromyces dobzhanskii CBS 2104]
MTYNYTSVAAAATRTKPSAKKADEHKEPQLKDNNGHIQQYHNYAYKKKPASYYLWSKSYRVRHKPLRLDRFPANELRKIRCGVFVGHQDHRCAYCPFHGIKHGFTLLPKLNCICRFKSLTPSPLNHEITSYMIMKSHSMLDRRNVHWTTGRKQLDRIVNHICANSASKQN